MGYRFRLHRKDLPGKPDIVLPKWGIIILVHGCFWHGHKGCCEGHIPKSNAGYWGPKLAGNRQRNINNLKKLRSLGWACIVIWECQTDNLSKLKRRLCEAMSAALNTQRSVTRART